MTSRKKNALMLIAALGVSACGGGGGGSTTNSTPQPIPGTNGLNYGFPGQQIDQAEGVEITQQSANFQGTATSIAAGAVTLGNGFTTNSANTGSGTVQIFGETVTITNGEGLLPSNGQTVNVIFDPSQSGTYAGAVAVVSYGTPEGNSAPLDGETHTVFGFETNPDTINGFDAITGNVTYQGGFQASGLVRDNGNAPIGANDGTEMDGKIEITANFANNTASGTLNGTYNIGSGDIPVNLALGSTPITSNGFAGTLSCTALCNSTSEVDATFYGPDADELGGVLSLDVTQDSNDEQYDGAGTFIITRQ